MLEDDFNDSLGKAIRGLAIPESELPLSGAQLRNLLSGKMDAKSVREIAPLLDLNAEKLIQLENYSPSVAEPSCLHTFVSPFGHLGVNAFIVETANHLLIFDTGTDSTDLLNFIAHHPEKQATLFITHGHPDHTAGIPKFHNITIHHPGKLHGETLHFDELEMTFLDVAGHCSPATAYLLNSPNLQNPISIVGDAIFAGSTGGCHSKSAYQTALTNIRENILTLPPETILCPGHGPLTTVAQELENNPFF